MYRRLGDGSNREIVSFRSCVRASGRGEAKLRAGVRRCASCGWGFRRPNVLRVLVRVRVPVLPGVSPIEFVFSDPPFAGYKVRRGTQRTSESKESAVSASKAA